MMFANIGLIDRYKRRGSKIDGAVRVSNVEVHLNVQVRGAYGRPIVVSISIAVQISLVYLLLKLKLSHDRLELVNKTSGISN